jgi:hypothetical protein
MCWAKSRNVGQSCTIFVRQAIAVDAPALDDDSELPARISRGWGRWTRTAVQVFSFGVKVAWMRVTFDPGSHIEHQCRPRGCWLGSTAAAVGCPLADLGCIQPRTDVLRARLGAIVWALTLVHLYHDARLSRRAKRPKPVGVGSSRLADCRGQTKGGGHGYYLAADLCYETAAPKIWKWSDNLSTRPSSCQMRA